eukprot:969716-Pelagomonas_calceolata.AAC.4
MPASASRCTHPTADISKAEPTQAVETPDPNAEAAVRKSGFRLRIWAFVPQFRPGTSIVCYFMPLRQESCRSPYLPVWKPASASQNHIVCT